MNFQIAQIKTPQQVAIYSYHFSHQDSGQLEGEVESKLLSISDLDLVSLNLAVYGHELDPETKNLLHQGPQKAFPVIELKNLSEQDLNSPLQALEMLRKYSSSWALRNNLHTLENIFSIQETLCHLWRQDRIGFVEEFWALLKSNFAPTELKVFFHDVERAEKENERDRLIWAKAVENSTGELCEILPCEESELTLVENLNGKFDSEYTVVDSDKMLGIYSYLIKIDHGPILIMMKSPAVSHLGQSLMVAIAKGLQFQAIKGDKRPETIKNKKNQLH